MPGCERRAWIRLGLAALVGLALLEMPAQAAGDSVNISATLIRASNDTPSKGGPKKDLPGILRNFKSYENYGGGSANSAVPGNASLSLGHGNSLSLRLSPSSENRVEVGINWRGPAGAVLNTTVRLTRGGPAVYLGGAQQDGGTMIISVTAR